jgi:hypothetical protein
MSGYQIKSILIHMYLSKNHYSVKEMEINIVDIESYLSNFNS